MLIIHKSSANILVHKKSQAKKNDIYNLKVCIVVFDVKLFDKIIRDFLIVTRLISDFQSKRKPLGSFEIFKPNISWHQSSPPPQTTMLKNTCIRFA